VLATQSAADSIAARGSDDTGHAAAALDAAATRCFHCGAPNSRPSAWKLELDGAERSFCCAGCIAIAQTIRAAGLEGFYLQRIAPTGRSMPADEPWTRYDAAAEAGAWVTRAADGSCEASLLLEGIHCAACVCLNESYLKRQPGVLEVSINFATRRARVRWNPQRARLSDLLRAVSAIGYRAYPYDPQRREALARREARWLLARTAIALLAMMQVMMFALPGYITADGIAGAIGRERIAIGIGKSGVEPQGIESVVE